MYLRDGTGRPSTDTVTSRTLRSTFSSPLLAEDSVNLLQVLAALHPHLVDQRVQTRVHSTTRRQTPDGTAKQEHTFTQIIQFAVTLQAWLISLAATFARGFNVQQVFAEVVVDVAVQEKVFDGFLRRAAETASRAIRRDS